MTFAVYTLIAFVVFCADFINVFVFVIMTIMLLIHDGVGCDGGRGTRRRSSVFGQVVASGSGGRVLTLLHRRIGRALADCVAFDRSACIGIASKFVRRSLGDLHGTVGTASSRGGVLGGHHHGRLLNLHHVPVAVTVRGGA